ncbi:MAG: M15 family metallopeptidase [Bdellovibrionales bacterium]|nr:M15 family metallopeptidase [Bdellovibrionales bacterium]
MNINKILSEIKKIGLLKLVFVIISISFLALFITKWSVKTKLTKNNISTDKSEFLLINKLIPSAIFDVRYNSNSNFLGTKVDGYKASYCYLEKSAAMALKEVQKNAIKKGYSLKIFDCYRPQKAVDHFVRWAKDIGDTKMKNIYYPKIDKLDIIPKGYIADKSGHTRGSTADLTLVNIKNNIELDMGTPFDFFDTLSNTADKRITLLQKKNRNILGSLMSNQGFVNYKLEWWHFTLNNEKFPNTYFNFDVK